MTRLYYCTAYCTTNTLISYRTTIFTHENNIYSLYAFRSSTTLSHIRKYIQWLREQGKQEQAAIVNQLYRYCIDNKRLKATMINGEIVSEY